MDKIDKRALRSLLGLLREHGVTSFASGDLAIELGPAPAPKTRGERPATVDPVISGHLDEADPLEARLNALNAKRAQAAEQKRAARG